MANYVNKLPMDVAGSPLQEFPPAVTAKVIYQRENNVASSIISLGPNTTSVEVGAFGGQGVVIKWISTTNTSGTAANQSGSVVASGLSANFDHWVPSATYRKFAVPKETQGQMAGGQIGSVNGLYQRVALINGGTTAASVLLVEY